MKILEIIPNIQSGGAEKFVVDLTNEFSAQGHECTLVTLFELNSKDIFKNIVSKKVNIVSLGKRLGFDLKCLYELYRYIRFEKPDVVHAHVGGITYLILAVLFYRKCKYFATIHNDARVEAGSGLHKIIRKFFFKYELVIPITISEESEFSFQQYYGTFGVLIPNGCSPYKPDDMIRDDYRKDVDFLFVHVASIQPSKNQVTLVKAFNKLLSNGIRARLLMIGRNANDEIFNNLKPYFSENIIYLGEKQNPRAYMDICDAFCLSSLWEGMPITIIEAFSVGCPPVVTPVGGCANMVEDGVNGLLAKDTTEEACYEVLNRFVKLNDFQKMELKKNCFKVFSSKYSIEKTASEYLNLFTRKN